MDRWQRQLPDRLHCKPYADTHGTGFQIGEEHSRRARFLRRIMYINDAFFSIVPGNEARAYAALGVLAAEIKAKEPDTWFYLIHTPNFDPGINIYPPPSPMQV